MLVARFLEGVNNVAATLKDYDRGVDIYNEWWLLHQGRLHLIMVDKSTDKFQRQHYCSRNCSTER